MKKRGWTYKRNTAGGSPIDGFISLKKEGVEKVYAVQMKYVTTTKENSLDCYSVCSLKTCGMGVHEPYHVNDGIDFFIVEIGGIKDNLQEFHGNFLIIPRKVMIEKEIFTSDTVWGSQTFSIRPSDYQKEHWSTVYWNKIPDELVRDPEYTISYKPMSYWAKISPQRK